MSSLKSLGLRLPFRGSAAHEEAAEAPDHLFSLKRNAIHALGILNNLNEQRKNASHYCDVQIMTSDQRDLWAHKIILDVFTNYFDEPGRFVLTDIDAKTMEGFLEYVYTGDHPKLDAENSLKFMMSSLELGLNQSFRYAITYCVDNIFEVMSGEYFCSLPFEKLSTLPVFDESYLLDKLKESKFRRIMHKWISAEPETRLDYRCEMENLFSKLWTVEDHERALALGVNQQGVANFVQFNPQDRMWYPCEFSFKPPVETALSKVLQMGLYKTEHFVFRDTSDNVYYSSTQFKRMLNKSSTLGTLVGSHCVSLKQIDGQIYALFDTFKKWNGESRKFETVIPKDVFHRLEVNVRDFTVDDRNSNIYFLCVSQSDPDLCGILTYTHNPGNPSMVTHAGLATATNVLTAGDDHLLVFGSSASSPEVTEGDVYVYAIAQKRFHQDLYLNQRFNARASLFRLNNKTYSLMTTMDEAGPMHYRVQTFPLKYEECKLDSIQRTDDNISYVKAVCVCPRKAYYDTVYGSPHNTTKFLSI